MVIEKVKIGSTLWILSVQYFIVEGIVQHAWNIRPFVIASYSMRFNYISDLGASACLYFPRGSVMYVCSPLHALMNTSFILNGIIAIIGALLLRSNFSSMLEKGRSFINAGLILIAVGSLGNFGVGLFPQNTILIVHAVSAVILFTYANAGLILVGAGMARTRRMNGLALFTVVLGTIGLVALLILVTKTYSFLGVGLVERMVAYPLTVWLIVAGFSVLCAQKSVI